MIFQDFFFRRKEGEEQRTARGDGKVLCFSVGNINGQSSRRWDAYFCNATARYCSGAAVCAASRVRCMLRPSHTHTHLHVHMCLFSFNTRF